MLINAVIEISEPVADCLVIPKFAQSIMGRRKKLDSKLKKAVKQDCYVEQLTVPNLMRTS